MQYTGQLQKYFNYSTVIESKQQLVHEYLERSTDKQQAELRWQFSFWNTTLELIMKPINQGADNCESNSFAFERTQTSCTASKQHLTAAMRVNRRCRTAENRPGDLFLSNDVWEVVLQLGIYSQNSTDSNALLVLWNCYCTIKTLRTQILQTKTKN